MKLKLSEILKKYRTDRPDEWSMDMFTEKAKELEDKISSMESEVKFLMELIDPLLNTYDKEYEEHEMPHGYPTPDTYYITVDRIRKLIS